MIALTSVSDLDLLGPEYGDLFHQSDATAFQHPLWLHAQYKSLAAAYNAEPLFITGRDEETAQLLFVLPLIKRRKHRVTIAEFADFGVTDYCAPVMRNGIGQIIARDRNLCLQFRQLIGRHDVLRIKAVRPEHTSLIENLTGMEPDVSGIFAHELPLTMPLEDLRKAKYSTKHRHNMNAARRRLAKAGEIEFRRLTDGQ